MRYLAILGRQPELGRAELEAAGVKVEPFGSQALIDRNINLNQFGGTVKLARVINEVEGSRLSLPRLDIAPGETKRNFGLSAYGFPVTPARLKALGLELKKNLPGKWRLVAPSGTALSSAQLLHNKIPSPGFELVMAAAGGRTIYALTEQVQDIDWYSRRDYEKPMRDSRIGMLPPKLAQIIINLTGEQSPVWDPFCGSGTVLAEALLKGLPAYGSDLNLEMVEASQANLSWLAQQLPGLPSWQVEPADALSARMPHPDCTVASEGYLGPALHSLPSDISSLTEDLTNLYANFLSNLTSQLPQGKGLCVCLPAWRQGQSYKTLPLIDRLTDLGYDLRRFQTADTRRLIYHRPGQTVGRQLLSLRKI